MSIDWFKAVENSLRESYKTSVQELLRFSKAPLITELKGEVDSTPSDVVYSEDRIKLLHYKPLGKNVLPVPMLIVYALINRYYILDLQQDRSIVRRYLEKGIDVYVIDWGDPSPSDRHQTIGDHIAYIDTIVDVIRERSKAESITLQGYCMGGTFTVIYSSLYPEKIKNLIVQAAPIDFSTQSGILNVWSKSMDADKIVDAFGNVPAQLLNIGFLMMNPVRLMLDKYVSFYRNIEDKEFVENFLRMEKWIFDSPDVPGELYRQFLKDLYQKNLLVKNELIVDGRRVDLSRIDMPLLSIVADHDNLVTPDSSRLLNELVSSKEKELFTLPTGHIGLSVSAKAHKEFWPKVANWIADRSKNRR